MKKILVIGSLNMDNVIETPYMPQSGETLTGKSFSQVPGGKGANQAYAVGKLGGNVSMIGAVADDSVGDVLKKNLEAVGVNTAGISVIPGATTGQAFITVDAAGANSIILIAGTNGMVTKEMIDQNRALIEECDILMMQLEIDWIVMFSLAFLPDKSIETRFRTPLLLSPHARKIPSLTHMSGLMHAKTATTY